MAFQSVPGCVEAVTRYVLNSKNIVNVLTFRAASGDYDQAAVDQLSAYIDGWVGAYLLNDLPQSIQYLRTDVRGLQEVNDVTASAAASAGAGTFAAPAMPNQVTFVIKFLSGLTGRSARGRWYAPAIPLNMVQANERLITATHADALRDALTAMALGLPAGWIHVVVSRYADKTQRPTGVFFPVLSYAYTDLFLDTQRRRQTP